MHLLGLHAELHIQVCQRGQVTELRRPVRQDSSTLHQSSFQRMHGKTLNKGTLRTCRPRHAVERDKDF
jgi:hypothetical protein